MAQLLNDRLAADLAVGLVGTIAATVGIGAEDGGRATAAVGTAHRTEAAAVKFQFRFQFQFQFQFRFRFQCQCQCRGRSQFQLRRRVVVGLGSAALADDLLFVAAVAAVAHRVAEGVLRHAPAVVALETAGRTF